MRVVLPTPNTPQQKRPAVLSFENETAPLHKKLKWSTN